jgi:hypothetical protein
VSAPLNLQAEIDELVNFPDKPAADWVAQVRGASGTLVNAFAGLIPGAKKGE